MASAPLCTGCAFFHGGYERDLCLYHGVEGPVRGWEAVPVSAARERAPRWFGLGKSRCGPEGSHFRPARSLPPPFAGSDD